jgi:radical SAM protein with 4Fe4S-binding SPASM domain
MGSLLPPALPLQDLGRRLDLSRRRVPIDGTIEPTFRCNLKCGHCYVNEPADSRAARDGELSLPRLLRLIDEIAEAGTLFLLLSGGEPLLRHDFPELHRHAVRRGLLVSLFTNATLVTDETAELLGENPPYAVEVSVYGATAKTYERVTRVPGSFDRCLAGIERLAARRLPLKLKTMALTWNAHEIDAMEKWAKRLGVPFRFDGLLNPRIDGQANERDEAQLSPAEVVALDHRSGARRAELTDFCRRSISSRLGSASSCVFSCGAARTTFNVDPYGWLHPCALARRVGYDLRHGTFAEGWNDALLNVARRKWRSRPPCRECSLAALCSSCPGAAELELGDAEAFVPHFCETTHLRAHELLGSVPEHAPDASCCLGSRAPARREIS